MPTLTWSDELSLGVAAMDATHVEFVDLLAQTEAASDADLLDHWARLVEHTDSHFANEDRYLADRQHPIHYFQRFHDGKE